MEISRAENAQPYDAPGHFGMTALRMHGGANSALKDATVGISHFEPGGGASLSASTADRVYVVLSGCITVEAGGQSATLSALDSCFIPAGESRLVENRSAEKCTMLVYTRIPA